MTERYQENSRRTRRVADTSTVIAHLVAQQIEPTVPKIDYTYHPFQIVIEDAALGFDSEGNFHHPRVAQPRNRWDDMGNYTVDL